MKDLEELCNLVADMSEWLDRYYSIALEQDPLMGIFWQAKVVMEGNLFEEFMFDDVFHTEEDVFAVFVEFEETPEKAVKKMLNRFKLIDYYMKNKVFGDDSETI